ncbi:olfactory receptor 4C11-like [Sarcophilus harrisii]|uniref:olfactory receptor 4C11-like n=1 Tax=Sarcophilus harrisii TaxID=9305 RepID=UPI000273C7C8|nr:olfactory receptor 4C11-like [Sarcophilus harrisii]
MKNNVTEFILLGLTQDPLKQKVVFAIFLVFYTATVLGNLLVILTIKTSPTLGSPMYFFLTYLSFADSCFSSTIAPKLIVDNLSKKQTISFDGCMTQLFCMHFFGCMEVLVLVLMSYDRYVAICKPLHYTVIMNQKLCGILVIFAWVGALVHSITQIAPAFNLPFCGPNVIDHYLCDLQPLLRLACADTYVINLLVVSNSGIVCMASFTILMTSYIFILYSLRNHSAEGKRKALSTCTAHIIVVIIFFVPCIFIYTRPPIIFPVDKLVSVFYTIGTPLLNPLIYTLRNAEVKNAMVKLWSNRLNSDK